MRPSAAGGQLREALSRVALSRSGWASLSALALVTVALAGCGPSPKSSHRVAATVSGLVGNGLVLEVNGHDGVEVKANGEATLAYLAGDAYYSVTVKKQPLGPAQVCEVANGTGTVRTADVTDVEVTCVIAYGIGGTVRGLEGTGLTLHVSLGQDRAEDLAVAGDGSFMFSGRAATLTAYTVTVSQQPSGARAVFCSVGNATGVIADADVLDVTVVCAMEAFRIGGRVSGLVAGTRLVLQNNGTDDLALDREGEFAFGSPVADGATYEVSVKTQPTDPWQHCRVEAETGAGTVAGHAVDTVWVACTIDSFGLVVSVSGLEGTGLVLQNGEDELPIAADGVVPFPRHVQSGSPYDVRVKQQPTLPQQLCSVAHGAGMVRNADVTDVAVSCHGFGLPRLVENNDAGSAWAPEIVMDPAGNAIAVWYQYNRPDQPFGTHVWANRYVEGSGWGEPRLLSGDASATDVRVAMDPAGNAIAVWYQLEAGSRRSIWANRYAVGPGWGAPELIEVDPADARYPDVAMDAAGNAIAVWQDYDGSRIWANRYRVGSTWVGAQQIQASPAVRVYGPQVAMNASGDAAAVWMSIPSDTPPYEVWANLYSHATGTWGTAHRIEANLDFPRGEDAAIDSAGNAIFVYAKQDAGGYRTWASRYEVVTGWAAAAPIEQDPGYSECPRVAMDAAGDALATWTTGGNRYTAGSGWGAAETLAWLNTAGGNCPELAVDPAGNALLVWPRNDGMQSNIWGSRYVAGVGWTDALLVENDDRDDADVPRVTTNAAGNGFAVWVQSDGTRSHVWASRFR